MHLVTDSILSQFSVISTRMNFVIEVIQAATHNYCDCNDSFWDMSKASPLVLLVIPYSFTKLCIKAIILVFIHGTGLWANKVTLICLIFHSSFQ